GRNGGSPVGGAKSTEGQAATPVGCAHPTSADPVRVHDRSPIATTTTTSAASPPTAYPTVPTARGPPSIPVRNSAASFRWGKGLPPGTGTPRNAQSGLQPSRTS